eukprot:3115470-Prymnesium_polylepis.1
MTASATALAAPVNLVASQAAPVDCQWSDWYPSGGCSCSSATALAAPANLVASQAAPVDCQWSDWYPSGGCSC